MAAIFLFSTYSPAYKAEHVKITWSFWPIFSNIWTLLSLSHLGLNSNFSELHVNLNLCQIYVTYRVYLMWEIWILILCLCAKWAQIHMDLFVTDKFRLVDKRSSSKSKGPPCYSPVRKLKWWNNLSLVQYN